jgi:soluble lytic murein transglycosylase-like protein
VRRRGCGCAALGCAVPLVVLLILAGAIGVVAGNWAALPRPKVPAAPPAVADIPADYLVLYRAAADRFGLDWSVLAAVGEVETNHGRNANGCAPNSAGARGPMQFLPPTFVHAAKLAGIA